jgi:SnoaL-like domain
MNQLEGERTGTLTVADRLEIHELLARRAYAADSHDVEAWVDTFTPAGVLEQPDVVLDLPGGASRMETTVSGAGELRAFLEASLPNIVGLRHWISNVITEASPDGAVARSLFNVVDVNRGSATVVSGRYTDIVTKTDEGWKTARLVVLMDSPTG